MNLKKIIRESLGDWDWTQFDPVEPRKEGEVRIGDVYTIYSPDKSTIRYVFEIVEISSDEYEGYDEEDDNGGIVEYKMIVTQDDELEPVGSIQTTSEGRAKRLIIEGYWILTDSLDKGFIGENYDDLTWIKETVPVGEMIIDALKSNKLYDVRTDYDDKGDLIDLEIHASDGSGRFFGITYKNITYNDVLEESKDQLIFCYENNTNNDITQEYRELYNLLNNYINKDY